MRTATAIRFDDLTLGYGRRPAVHHLDGEVAAGSLTAVVGPNGSGKSTLLKGIVGVIKPMAGRIEHHAGCRMAYLPQHSEIDRHFPAQVRDIVALGLWPKRGMLGRLNSQDRQEIGNALAAVGLDGF